ncbi:hypothetical protein DBR43_00870 [Pedobacter sp. KBW06]|uniref:hypothetical protein n=1 Tax=Pedobacter sp. KBW06 TaxID=2153359 RepID=UPI000F5A741F|nr:hypothetical protein [Pedobacter sp. KBW06]RQO73992.1 hypothetical protein DBR43_00870 [Pedobacter sp. KBW06]
MSRKFKNVITGGCFALVLTATLWSCKKAASGLPEAQVLSKKSATGGVGIDPGVGILGPDEIEWVGGTIGCSINLGDEMKKQKWGSPGWAAANDNYEKCMAGALSGKNKIPTTEAEKKKLLEEGGCITCKVEIGEESFMHLYWYALGGASGSVLAPQEIPAIKERLRSYNEVILQVFPHPEKVVSVPGSFTEQRAALLSYPGTLPAGIIEYVKIAYSEYFYIASRFAGQVLDLEELGGGTLHMYGVKYGERNALFNSTKPSWANQLNAMP